MKTLKVTLSLVIVMGLACGCQATPERTPVVYGGGLEEKLQGTPAPFGTYDAPARWQETLSMKGSDTKVEIDAAINVPDVTAFPVYKVKPSSFDVMRIEALVSYFTKGRDVIEDTEPTKADLENQLILAKKGDDEEMIAELEKKIAEAPETVEAGVITDWSPENKPSGSFLAEDGEYAQIDVTPDRFDYTKQGWILTDSMLVPSGLNQIDTVAISGEDAAAAAQTLLHALGIDDMAAASLEKAQWYASIKDAFAQPAKEPLSQGYVVKFARDIGGIAGVTDHAIMFGLNDFAYKAPLYPEEMQVYVDDAGKAQSFLWLHPVTVEEPIIANAPLLPFEDIEQRIRDILTYIDFNDPLPVQVTHIDMNMAMST